jgi:hypothetical protein
MPKGYVSFQGRTVSTMDPEYRAHIAANPTARKKGARKAVDPRRDDQITDVTHFEPPDASSMEPPRANSKAEQSRPIKSKRAADLEDEEDLIELIKGLYAGLAMTTAWPGWYATDAEAGSIARPFKRILARHKELEGVVRQFVDPVALIIAVAASIIPKGIAYAAHVASLKRVGNAGANIPAPPPPRPSAPPVQDVEESPPPPANGVDPLAVQRTLAKLHMMP